MPWIVKNVTKGIVCVSDIKLVFAPGEEIDVDTSVHVQRNGGSDHLLRLISKGTLQTISRGPVTQAEEILMPEEKPKEVSQPIIQSVPEYDPDRVKEAIREVISETANPSMNVGDLKEAFKEAFSEALSAIRQEMTVTQMQPQSQTQSVVQASQGSSSLNLDEINAKIHSRRIDESSFSGEITSKQEESEISIEDKLTSLRKMRKE